MGRPHANRRAQAPRNVELYPSHRPGQSATSHADARTRRQRRALIFIKAVGRPLCQTSPLILSRTDALLASRLPGQLGADDDEAR